MKERKTNNIYFYCSWILPYIQAKGVLIENELDYYLVQETEKAIEFLKKIAEKEIIDSVFIADFSQFCIYVSNMRHTVQSIITEVEDFNKNGDDYPIIFNTNDLIILDRLLQILYDNYRCLVEFDTIDRSTNFLHCTNFFSDSLRIGSADILKNDYEISVKFIK